MAHIRFQAVLFDLDGTLIDSRGDIAAAANHARAAFGLPPLSEEAVGAFVGRGVRHLAAGVLETGEEDRIEQGVQVLMDHYRAHPVDRTTVFPGAFELLSVLKEREVDLGVVSNKPEAVTGRVLEALGLTPYFAVVLGHEATPRAKPHPDPLLLALERLGSSPAASALVGDSPVDVEAARAAGMRVAVVAHGFSSRKDLEAAGPDWIAGNLEGLRSFLTG